MAAAAVLAVTACGGSSAPEGAPAARGACSAGELPQLQGSNHLLTGDPPVPYSSTPPTSGWHTSGPPRTGVIPTDDPLSDPELVNTLEAGHVVVAYDPEAVPEDAAARLEELAVGVHDGRLTVTPYEVATPTPVTYLAWGVLQRCEEVDADALDAFVLEYAGRVSGEPE